MKQTQCRILSANQKQFQQQLVQKVALLSRRWRVGEVISAVQRVVSVVQRDKRMNGFGRDPIVTDTKCLEIYGDTDTECFEVRLQSGSSLRKWILYSDSSVLEVFEQGTILFLVQSSSLSAWLSDNNSPVPTLVRQIWDWWSSWAGWDVSLPFLSETDEAPGRGETFLYHSFPVFVLMFWKWVTAQKTETGRFIGSAKRPGKGGNLCLTLLPSPFTIDSKTQNLEKSKSNLD